MSKPENPSAFPLNTANISNPGAFDPAPGMTLRDWFAGQALQSAWDACDKGCFDGAAPEIAACAYQIADAMLAARTKGGAA